MDSNRGVGKQMIQNETPEQLLDVFKAAALSVTKLYKTSALAQSKARSDGYQDCLDDLLAFLDKENLGLNDGEGWRIRRWATERLDGRETGLQTSDSEDDTEKSDPAPESTRTNDSTQLSTQTRTNSAIPTVSAIEAELTPIVVPTQEHFTFQSSHPYPNIATLDLSDSRPQDPLASVMASKARFNANTNRSGGRTTHMGQRTGSKRKLNFEEIFDLGSLGGKDPFGNGNKRSRHT